MPQRRSVPPPAPRVANLPWLDFVNTRFIDRHRWVDAIPSPRALADWLGGAGLGPAGGARKLAALRGRPGGRGVLREAHVLRSRLSELAHALASGAPPPAATVTAINQVLRAAPVYRELRSADRELVQRVVPAGRHPLALLGPVAESAADFLVAGDRTRLRACGNPKCVLYFYDRTRNGHRRFCSAATCGNRVKAARRYERRRAGQSG